MFPYRIPTVGLAAGLLFAIMDGLISANPEAQHLYSVYRPLTRKAVNAPLGLTFDLVWGIVMAFLFVALTSSFPGGWSPKESLSALSHGSSGSPWDRRRRP